MKIRTKVYFYVSLLFPLLIPLLASIFENTLASVFQLSIYLGGIPYVLFALGLFVWLKNKPNAVVLRLSWAAPILFLPIFSVYIIIHQISRDWVSISDFSAFDVISLLVGYSVYVVIFGYFYVILMHLLYRLLDKLNILISSDNDGGDI